MFLENILSAKILQTSPGSSDNIYRQFNNYFWNWFILSPLVNLTGRHHQRTQLVVAVHQQLRQTTTRRLVAPSLLVPSSQLPVLYHYATVTLPVTFSPSLVQRSCLNERYRFLDLLPLQMATPWITIPLALTLRRQLAVLHQTALPLQRLLFYRVPLVLASTAPVSILRRAAQSNRSRILTPNTTLINRSRYPHIHRISLTKSSSWGMENCLYVISL